MTEYIVSLDIITDDSLDDEANTYLDVEDRVEKIKNITWSTRSIPDGRLWRLEYAANGEQSIENIIIDLFSQLPPDLIREGLGIRDFILSIGVLTENITSSLFLSNKVLKAVSEIMPGINIELTWYITCN